jgi:hypothetical protein
MDYFSEKERAGLCFLRNGVMFLLPPGPTASRYFKNEGDKPKEYFMVGVFGDATAAAAQQARFTGQGHNNNNMNK